MCRLEGVNQVELQAVQVRLLLSGLSDGRNAAVVVEEGNVVFQIGVQSASMPPGKAGQRIGPQFPESIDAVLQNVGGSSLIAFDERRDRGVLFFAVPGVTHLNVVLVLHLAYADIKAVFLVLAAESADDRTLGIQRMIFGIEVVQELQQDVDRQTREASLDLVRKDEIRVVVARVKVGHPFGVDVGGVGHAVGGKDAGWVGGEARALGAALSFAGNWSWSCAAGWGGRLEAGGGGSGCERAFLQNRIRTVPLQGQERGCDRPG